MTNIDLASIDASVSNKVTLTFSLTGANLSRYTYTTDIYVGKMQTNIATNQFVEKLKDKLDVSDNGLRL